MFRPVWILAAALLLWPLPAGAAPAKPAPKAAAAKPEAARPAGRFDARDPASLIALLTALDAKAQVARTTEDGVELSVVTPGFSFGAQFVGCGPTKKACQGLAFSSASEKQRANLAQINGFNQTSVTCRMFMDQAGKSHVMYATMLFPTDTREGMRVHLGVWQGCLASFGAFLGDPNGYLAAAP